MFHEDVFYDFFIKAPELVEKGMSIKIGSRIDLIGTDRYGKRIPIEVKFNQNFNDKVLNQILDYTKILFSKRGILILINGDMREKVTTIRREKKTIKIINLILKDLVIHKKMTCKFETPYYGDKIEKTIEFKKTLNEPELKPKKIKIEKEVVKEREDPISMEWGEMYDDMFKQLTRKQKKFLLNIPIYEQLSLPFNVKEAGDVQEGFEIWRRYYENKSSKVG